MQELKWLNNYFLLRGFILFCVTTVIIFVLISSRIKLNIKILGSLDFGHFKLQPLTTPLIEPKHINLRRTLDWQEVTEIGGADDETKATKIFIYSSYYDINENSTILRVISVTPSFSRKLIYCHIYNQEIDNIGIVPGTITTVKSGQNILPYSAAFIICDLTDEKQNDAEAQKIIQNMKFVSISSFSSPQDQSKISNIVNIIFVPPPIKDGKEIVDPFKFAICVQPMFKYDNVFEFIQWMEFQKMMGVEHFSFYNMSIGPRVSCVMHSKWMNRATPISVMNWTAPILNLGLLHMNAQIAQGNDCIFRYRGVSKYVLSVDVDEYFIPNYIYATNYADLIEVIHTHLKGNLSNRTIAQYQFRSGFFGSDFGSFNPYIQFKKNQIELEDLVLFKYVARQKHLYPYKVRSKFISIPRQVIEPGIHYLEDGVGKGVELEIEPEIIFVHHYRPYRCGDNCSSVPQEDDFTAHFYAQQLLSRVRIAVDHLQRECGKLI